MPHVRAGRNEPGQLVAGEQRLVELRLARHAHEVGMGEHRVDDLVGILTLAQLLDAMPRVARLEVRIALVVEVVDEARDSPQLLVAAEAARVRTDGRLDGEHVLSERVGLGPLAHEPPGFVTRGHCSQCTDRPAA
jgi:hypothetical protein